MYGRDQLVVSALKRCPLYRDVCIQKVDYILVYALSMRCNHLSPCRMRFSPRGTIRPYDSSANVTIRAEDSSESITSFRTNNCSRQWYNVYQVVDIQPDTVVRKKKKPCILKQV